MDGGQQLTVLPGSAGRRYGRVFDEIAAEYDRHRPAYPDELIDQACRIAGLGSGDAVLEVGCGSGQLTRSLAGRGLRVTALEPGTNLMSLARHNLAGDAEVEFVTASFEDAPLPRERFRAVFSASAFHWVDPEASWQRAADVLVPGGTLALVQYFGLEEARSKQDQDAVLGALARVAPDIAASWPAVPGSRRDARRDRASPRQYLAGLVLARQLRHRAGVRRPPVRRCSGGGDAEAHRAHAGRTRCRRSHDVVLRPALTRPAPGPGPGVRGDISAIRAAGTRQHDRGSPHGAAAG